MRGGIDQASVEGNISSEFRARSVFARVSHAWHTRRFSVTMACLAMMVLASWLDGGPRWPLDRTVTISGIQPELGNNFIAKLSRPDLSSDQAPLDSVLSEIHTIRGAAAFEEWDKRWSRLFAYRNVRGRILAKWPDFGIERRQVIGPGNQVHQAIRDQGRGRYSVWKGYLYFSASDNSSPATNGRRYELSVPLVAAIGRTGVAAMIRGFAFCVLVLTIVRALAERRWIRRVLANTVPGLAATAVMLTVLFGGFEAYQRWVRHNFADIVWPSRVDPVAGTIFEPGKELRWTNHVEFWTRTPVNSLGFLDVEPALPKPQGRFRILVVGDSMVEAVQVPIEAKVQRRLAAKLERRLGPGRADVVAFGYSGTGQANQLGFYEKFGRVVAPDLVILLALSNDLANNSPILESVRNGWHPYVAPRLFYERDGSGFRRVNPTVDWEQHRIGGNDAAAHYAALMQIPEFAPKLAGWGGPVERDTDAMFWQPTLPPLFEDAIVLTRHALEEWKMLAARDGFKLVVVGSDNMTPDGTGPFADRERYARRFQAVTEDVGLPFLDLYPYFAKQSDPKTAHWRIDAHWSPVGHEWAAAAIYEFLVSRGFVP